VGPVDSVPDKARVPGESLSSDERSQSTDQSPVDTGGGSNRPDVLRQRLDQLPAGHPSSPYDADGSLRQPIPRLRDLEMPTEDENLGHGEPTERGDHTDRRTDLESPNSTPATDRQRSDAPPAAEAPPDAEPHADAVPSDQRRPVTDEEWGEHVPDVRGRLDKAVSEDLATNHQHTSDRDGREWTPDRNRIQGALVADLYERARDVPCEGLAIIAGGLGGAGKSTVLSKHAGIDLSRYLTINPDNIKEEMAERGLVPEVEGLSPMEASELVHEESSYIAKRLALRATADQKNLIWDITMSSRESTERRINDLRAAGYTVDGIFVDIPVETSVRRADARHREGHNDYRAGIGLGGRYVPPEVIRAQADPDWGSQNRKFFEDVNPTFDHWQRFDNSVDGRAPVLAETGPPDDKNVKEKA